MRLLDVGLTDFRNISSARLELSPRFNALVGPNGQGKTNTLEALYLMAALRPLRSVNRRTLLREGTDKAVVEARVEVDATGLTHDLGLELTTTRRLLLKDGKRVEADAFLGHAVAVCFTPDDLQLAKGSPDGRRKFLDRALLNEQPRYLQRALRYAKAVKDRNKILTDDDNDALLDAFDAVIADEGAAIMVARAQYVAQIEARVRTYFERIATPAPVIGLRYHTRLEGLDPEDPERTRAAFLDKLARRRALDRARKSTSVGPHLDDVELTLDGQPVKERASQGQHRALVLALKLAEIAHLAERLGETPILLLDDMSSELDAHRSAQLFDAVRALDGQVVLTSTAPPSGLGELPDGDLALYRVDRGALTRG